MDNITQISLLQLGDRQIFWKKEDRMAWSILTILMSVFFIIAAIALFNKESEKNVRFENSLKNEVGETQKVLTTRMQSKQERDYALMVPNVGGSPHHDLEFGEGELVVRKFSPN